MRSKGSSPSLLTIEELDDVGKVHVVVDDDVPVGLDQGESDEQVEVRRADVLGRPDRFPHVEDVFVLELALKVEQEPTVGEEEVRVVAAVVHVLEEVAIEDLNERAHVGEVLVHGRAMREIGRHTLHELLEAAVNHRF